MLPSPTTSVLEFKDQLQRLVDQFSKYLNDSVVYNMVWAEDMSDLVSIIQEICIMDQDIDIMLRKYPSLFIRVSWFCNKYQEFLFSLKRQCTTACNKIYVYKRDSGWDEWSAKRVAEIDPEFLKLCEARDRFQILVNHLTSFVDVTKSRLDILQHLSNNRRAEDRTMKYQGEQ